METSAMLERTHSTAILIANLVEAFEQLCYLVGQ